MITLGKSTAPHHGTWLKPVSSKSNGLRAAQQASDKPSAYQTAIVLPVEEILLDPNYVGEKLKAAATPQKHPGGDVQRLIDECDWASLAAALVRDRELAVELSQKPPVDRGRYEFDPNMSNKILRRINNIAPKYLTELPSPSQYTLNNRAVRKPAGRVSGTKNPTSSDVMLGREEPTLVTGARSLFAKLTN
jgi:hypothetical protein